MHFLVRVMSRYGNHPLDGAIGGGGVGVHLMSANILLLFVEQTKNVQKLFLNFFFFFHFL